MLLCHTEVNCLMCMCRICFQKGWRSRVFPPLPFLEKHIHHIITDLWRRVTIFACSVNTTVDRIPSSRLWAGSRRREVVGPRAACCPEGSYDVRASLTPPPALIYTLRQVLRLSRTLHTSTRLHAPSQVHPNVRTCQQAQMARFPGLARNLRRLSTHAQPGALAVSVSKATSAAATRGSSAVALSTWRCPYEEPAAPRPMTSQSTICCVGVQPAGSFFCTFVSFSH